MSIFDRLNKIGVPVSDEEQEARKQATLTALGSVRMEGLEPSKECIDDMAACDAGHMSIEEAIERAKNR